MDNIVILSFGENLDKFRVKFVAQVFELEFADDGELLSDSEKLERVREEFKEVFLVAKDKYHAMLLANMLIEDFAGRVPPAPYYVSVKGEI